MEVLLPNMIKCQTAHCVRHKSHFDFGGNISPTVPYWYLPQTLRGMTAECCRTIPVCYGQPGNYKEAWAFQTEEGCLSLEGVRPCKRYEEIEVDYLDQNFKPQHGKYSGWTAQIILHEIDRCNDVVI